MKSRFFILLVVVGLAIGTIGTIGAAAQENESGGTGIQIEAAEETNTTEYAQEIDGTTRLVSWSYDDDREGFVLTFELDRSQQITLTEAVQFSEGAGSGRIYRERLPAGTSEVFVSVPRRGGQAAVTMVTPQSVENNRFSYVSTGEAEPDRPAIRYERVQLLVGGTAIGAGGLVFGLVKRRRESEEKEVERIL